MARINFGGDLNLCVHKASVLGSWVPQEYITIMLICKHLQPIAWQAFLETAVFVLNRQLGHRRTYTWWDTKLADDPTRLARRIQCNIAFAAALNRHWTVFKSQFPNLKHMSVTDGVWKDSNNDFPLARRLGALHTLQNKLLATNVKFEAYLLIQGHRTTNNRKYAVCYHDLSQR